MADAAPEPEVAAKTSKLPKRLLIIDTKLVDDDYTLYSLMWETTEPKSANIVARRFSDFVVLREDASVQVHAEAIEKEAPFPEKRWFGNWKTQVTEERQVLLENWLNALLDLEKPPDAIQVFITLNREDEAITHTYCKRMSDGMIANRGGPDDYPVYEGDKHYCVDPAGEVAVNLSKTGIANLAPKTLVDMFKLAKECGGEQKALRVETSPSSTPPEEKTWKDITWNQYFDDSERAAKSFMALGVERFGTVAILGFNSPEWFMSCMGAIMCGAKAAGIYATNEPDACAYIVDHSKAAVIVVENAKQCAKFTKSGVLDTMAAAGHTVTTIVQYSGTPDTDKVGDTNVMSWAAFLAVGESTEQAEYEERRDSQKPGQCASLIYTSGTTGPPKAVMISHDNAVWTSTSFLCFEPAISEPGKQHDIVSYLPLSHIAAQALDIFFPIIGTAGMGKGKAASFPITCWFAQADALKGSLKGTLQASSPTIFFGVPRVWEKFAEAIKAKAGGATGIKASVASWAKGTMLEAYKEGQAGGYGTQEKDRWTGFGHGTAASLMMKVREALGLTRCEYCYTGAAPITRQTLEYFGSLGIPVLELYGMSENTGPMTVSKAEPGGFLIGAAGYPMPGCQLKIDHEPSRDAFGNGEICFRGRHIMMGYMHQEDKTNETIDKEGWLHSGDVGCIDRFGLLHITGRIKELIITGGGENVAPVPIEDSIKKNCPGISNCVVVGDKQKFLMCLLTLKQAPDPDSEGHFLPQLVGDAAAISEAKTVAEAKKDPAWVDAIIKGITAYNKDDACSRAAYVQKFRILDQDFSFMGAEAELTGTMKLKRPVVYKKYAEVVAQVYSEKSNKPHSPTQGGN